MMHFGRYSFNPEVVDVIELQGDGSYHVCLYSYLGSTKGNELGIKSGPRVYKIVGEDADALREWLDNDKQREVMADKLDEAHLKSHE